MKTLLEFLGNGVMYILTVAQTNEVFQLVELILSVAISVFILVINIVSWYKRAKKDGKIDEEELEELKDIVEKGKEEIEK